MKGPKPSPNQVDWKKRDRRILIIFFGLLALVILGVSGSEIVTGDPDFLRAVGNVMGGLVGVFSFTGILAFYPILVAVIAFVTFVYFNNFEDSLARTTLRDLEKREDGRAMVAVEPEDA